MNIKKFFAVTFVLFFFWSFGKAQTLENVENELKIMAQDILYHDSLSHKIDQNKKFTRLLIQTLKRPESYKYDFDSLKTVSILSPSDKSFRLFTWYIVDKNFNEFYGEQYHYYFGLVQRKIVDENGKVDYIVIPLIQMPELIQGVESMVLDNNNWLGSLYYLPRETKRIPSYTIKYYNERTDKKEPKTFYLLLGWNGHDASSNYKIVDVMSFDEEEPEKVVFGANIFFFDLLPKYRAVFHYSEYSPFSLNFAHVKTGPFKMFKKEMIVFDHLASPNNANRELKDIYQLGADGSYDALGFHKTGGGGFIWYRNVVLAENYNSKQTRKYQEAVQKRELERLRKAGIDVDASNNN